MNISDIINIKIYMIRGGTGTGPFNTNFNIKLIFAILAISLIIYEYKKNNKRYFIALLTTGTMIWSCTELFLQLSGTREFNPGYLFGYEIPFWIQIPFQGLVEGAFVAIFCMFFSDRMINMDTRKKSIMTFSFLMILMIIESRLK